ncbi:hypothetical protein [Halobaculum magnesiiphilum]|uniref:Uncharacterized protein n=1 Tax=Halobaculum magnesiiphilum TaxID=1017351 RepID=A0A8T8WDI8_9EURY|nr:hypothetical protein [Halobaculum magnesiiphilum]QZP37932.1 hypothetical protein K6T50_01790 [Halobaculum magnesiiphilum]
MLRSPRSRTGGSTLAAVGRIHPRLVATAVTVLACVLVLLLTADVAAAADVAVDPSGVGDVSSGP